MWMRTTKELVGVEPIEDEITTFCSSQNCSMGLGNTATSFCEGRGCEQAFKSQLESWNEWLWRRNKRMSERQIKE
jgi:hypothetical protein